MEQRLSFVADDRLAQRVSDLAREYNLSTEEVLRQLITVGLEEIEGTTRSNPRRASTDGTRMGDD